MYSQTADPFLLFLPFKKLMTAKITSLEISREKGFNFQLLMILVQSLKFNIDILQ